MNLYRIDLTMVATAYLKADTPEDALRIAREHFEGRSTGIEFAQDQGGDLPVCGLEFSDPDMPALSLAPAMTISGLAPGAAIELAEEDVPASEDRANG